VSPSYYSPDSSRARPFVRLPFPDPVSNDSFRQIHLPAPKTHIPPPFFLQFSNLPVCHCSGPDLCPFGVRLLILSVMRISLPYSSQIRCSPKTRVFLAPIFLRLGSCRGFCDDEPSSAPPSHPRKSPMRLWSVLRCPLSLSSALSTRGINLRFF